DALPVFALADRRRYVVESAHPDLARPVDFADIPDFDQRRGRLIRHSIGPRGPPKPPLADVRDAFAPMVPVTTRSPGSRPDKTCAEMRFIRPILTSRVCTPLSVTTCTR